MPPKYKFNRQQVIAAGLELARKGGMAAVTARAVGAALGSSPKVIFGLFENMAELEREVYRAADALYQSRVVSAMQDPKYPPVKAGGMAYIRFAREEPQLFRLLFMQSRPAGEDVEKTDRTLPAIRGLLQKNTGLTMDNAVRMHWELWIFVHGIASLLATSYADYDEETISGLLTDCYLGLKHRFCGEDEHDSHQNQ